MYLYYAKPSSTQTKLNPTDTDPPQYQQRGISTLDSGKDNNNHTKKEYPLTLTGAPNNGLGDSLSWSLCICNARACLSRSRSRIRSFSSNLKKDKINTWKALVIFKKKKRNKKTTIIQQSYLKKPKLIVSLRKEKKMWMSEYIRKS